MRRRDVAAALLLSMACGCNQAASESAGSNVPSDSPEKIRLVPDEWRIEHVGRLADGRLFWVDAQLDPADGQTRDFVCTFVFDADGSLSQHSIELVGTRGEYFPGAVAHALERHLADLGERTQEAIWIRPFHIDREGVVFGLVPRQLPDGEWRVEFMPGNTLSFYAPWEVGEYDT
jgi:hypothetical protein